MPRDGQGELSATGAGAEATYYPAEVLALDPDGDPIFAHAWISEFSTMRAAMSCDQELQPGQRIDVRIMCTGRTIPQMFRTEEAMGGDPLVIRAQAEVISPLERNGAVFDFVMAIRFLGHFSIVHAVGSGGVL